MTKYSGPKIVELKKEKEYHAGRYLLEALDRMEVTELKEMTFVLMVDDGKSTHFASNANGLEEAAGYMDKAKMILLMDSIGGAVA